MLSTPLPGQDTALTPSHTALAGLALCEAAGLPRAGLVAALKRFRGLPHRVEKVAERADGVTYYDDSKGTNVGATVAALNGALRPVVLIAGGEGKAQDFAPLASAVKAHARAVVLIGKDRPAIAAALAGTGVEVIAAPSMAEAVLAAFEHALHGDHVYLSPACASFDMFRNYPHRAEVFRAAVHMLADEAGTMLEGEAG